MKDLAKRTVVSVISIIAAACLIVFSDLFWFQFIVAGVVAALTGIALWEYEQFVKTKGAKPILSALIAIGVILVLSFFASSLWLKSSSLPMLIFFLGFLILIALHFKEKEGALVDLAVSSFGLLYIAVPMGMILAILFGQTGGQDGRWWVAYLLVVTKITDIGGYFGGNLWGSRKLAPMISPGKTVEGAIVGLICSGSASVIFFLLSHFTGSSSFQLGGVEAIALGLILGTIGQFGDLSESLLKRDANKKDSNDLPGLGGVLDLTDSLLFNAFLIFFYTKYYL